MDELDEVTDSAHHGEPDCDGAADLKVLCATRRRRRGSGVSPGNGVGFGARGGVLPFLSGFVHREINCVRGGIKVRVSIRVFGHVPRRATVESGGAHCLAVVDKGLGVVCEVLDGVHRCRDWEKA